MEYKDVTDADIKYVIQSMDNPCSHRDNISYLYNYFLKKSYTPRMPNTYGMYYWETLRDACDKIKDPPERNLLISADTYVLTQTVQQNMALLNLFDANASYCSQMQQLAAAHQSAQSYYGAIFWNYKAYTLCGGEPLLQQIHELHGAAGLTYNKELLDLWIDIDRKIPPPAPP